MKKRVAPTIVLIAVFLSFLEFGAKASLPNLQALEHQLRFDLQSLGNVFEFQSPSMSHFSITYLTIEEVRRDALLLQSMSLQSIPKKQ